MGSTSYPFTVLNDFMQEMDPLMEGQKGDHCLFKPEHSLPATITLKTALEAR